jgi:hypothetical protein
MLKHAKSAAYRHTAPLRSTWAGPAAVAACSPSAAASSSVTSRGRGRGSSHHISRPSTTPPSATTQNVWRHPMATMIGATTSGASPAPMLLEASISPALRLRVCGGVRSASALNDAPGNSACATPNRQRTASSATSPPTIPVAAVNTDHATSETTRSGRAPKRSAASPPGTWNTM